LNELKETMAEEFGQKQNENDALKKKFEEKAL